MIYVLDNWSICMYAPKLGSGHVFESAAVLHPPVSSGSDPIILLSPNGLHDAVGIFVLV